MVTEQKQVRELQEGNYVMMDDAPCQITAYSTAKPGKHGSAKARIEGRGVFDDKKRSLSQPVDAKIYVPVVERKGAQVVSVDGDEAQVMDLDDFQTFTMAVPDGEDFSPDDEIEFLEFEGQRRIVT
jgi:translation initiation factor 5A